jgi:CheY-like chemotaxis protein
MEKTICVIDDTPDLLANVSEFLQMEGFAIVPCNSGKEALQYLQQHIPDLIITDLWMPPMDGLVFVEKIKSDVRLSDIPVVIFSAKQLVEYEEKARLLGVVDYIKKPADLDQILNVIYPLLFRYHDR